MPILAIDTSCDETSVAVTHGPFVLSNVVASQAQLHQKYGGVFPTVAKQAHQENIGPTTQAALQRAGVDWAEIEAIAVTQGPGLAPALEIGINYAFELGEEHTKPVIPINHIEGHVLSVLAEPKPKGSQWHNLHASLAPNLPALALVISGGHSEFILVEEKVTYTRLGWTIDDAAGEALDKVGRMLDLGYPAGPVIEKFSQHGDATAYNYPLPMTTSGDYNLSFSGLKTYSRNLIRELDQAGQLNKQAIYNLAASFQRAVFRHITHKLEKVLSAHPEIQELWLGGGVAANTELRKQLRATTKKFDAELEKKGQQARNLPLKTPYSKKLCGDNGAMIGVVASTKPLRNSKKFERMPRLKIN